MLLHLFAHILKFYYLFLCLLPSSIECLLPSHSLNCFSYLLSILWLCNNGFSYLIFSPPLVFNFPSIAYIWETFLYLPPGEVSDMKRVDTIEMKFSMTISLLLFLFGFWDARIRKFLSTVNSSTKDFGISYKTLNVYYMRTLELWSVDMVLIFNKVWFLKTTRCVQLGYIINVQRTPSWVIETGLITASTENW